MRLYDPDPGRRAQGRRGARERATRACGRLTLAPLPPEGAVDARPRRRRRPSTGVELVQESAPEREELKRELLAAASRAAAAGRDRRVVDVGPAADAAAGATWRGPERFVRRPPVQPRLPAAARRARAAASGPTPETVDARRRAVPRRSGMRPARAARARSTASSPTACSRRCGARRCGSSTTDVATVEEIDDAIRFGAGLRWACMGTFLTYRIAGGEAGMRHFMAQFGPALQWPWTKLTDVPELTDELLDRIVAQSDAQADGRSVRELERLRDDCLVAVLQGLRAHDFGAGAVLARLRARAASTRAGDAAAGATTADAAAAARGDRPPRVGRLQRPRHTRAATCRCFGDATDALLRHIGVDAAYLAAGAATSRSRRTSRTSREARAGDRLHVDDAGARARREAPARLPRAASARDDAGRSRRPSRCCSTSTPTRASAARRHGPGSPARIARTRQRARGLPRPERAGRGIDLERRGRMRRCRARRTSCS